ncbi:zinc finger protein 638-like [Pempheris klunzingeri]|uniref:zinc finger protein 638-like n=1 Tax=Pempheris klunzingeri TaxID=3127111 RepID=UPI003981099A
MWADLPCRRNGATRRSDIAGMSRNCNIARVGRRKTPKKNKRRRKSGSFRCICASAQEAHNCTNKHTETIVSGQTQQQQLQRPTPPRCESLAVHTDSNSHLAPTLRLEPSATFSIGNTTRRTHFTFGPVAGAAAATALRLAQAQIALQQLATLATITVGNQCLNNNGFAAASPPNLALLSLLNRQWVSAVGLNLDTNCKTYRNTQLCHSAAMYHHSQQHGSQPFSNGPPHQPPPNQHQNRPPSDMLSQVMGFQFPRPTQLPDELESALAIRGARDMDHRLIDHVSRPNQHQNQSSGSGISQHGSYGSNPLTSDNQPAHQQGVDWSSYQPPTKLFASPPPSASHQSQRHQGPQQQTQGSHTGTSMPSWTAPVSDSPSPQTRHPHGGIGDGQGMYTPESAGSILASFGLSNEDLEVLSHYPDDQLTPDTLPFILRDIQINKASNQKTVASTSSSPFSRSIHDVPLPPSRSSPMARSRSPEVPSLLTVTQTAGKVIDYGHASRAKDESGTRETFKREQLSSERTIKMFPSSSSSSSSDPKPDKTERRQVRLEHNESSKHGDRDYRRTSSDHRKSNHSPLREFPPSSKSRNLDQDYRRDGPKPRPSSETRSEASSRRSVSSSSGSKPHSSSKKLPTPTMISDFSAVSPKVYPHTCSLCHIQCDQEKDWVEHINTVNHTAACRDLRNKYPDWKPNLPRRSGRYGSRALWDPKDRSPSHSLSRSLSCSPSPSPPPSKHRVGPDPHRPRGRPYSPHHHPRHQRYAVGSFRSGVKRPYDDSTKFSPDTSRHPSYFKAGHSSKHVPLQSFVRTVRTGTKPGTKTTKAGSAKAVDTCAKPPAAKKKRKTVTPASQDLSVADRLVYLTGIPKDASEQEVTDLVGSFGRINNVILLPCSEEGSENGEGQNASVCMVKAEDAQALANSSDLSIRDQPITASVAKKMEAEQSSDANNSKPATGQDKGAAEGETAGGEADQKTSDEKGMVLISGLPESGWSESDIITLVQPFGTPSDIILATHLGKVLVSVPHLEIAQEMVKVHTFTPMKMKDVELKMIHLKQCVGLSTPVALYNLLMGSGDLLESHVPVGWSSLLVISNVPSTPSGSSEVQKLVRRFGTVIKTLVLNSMVICEMATAAMALSVYKRFQTFPCIIQNNPLFFSRRPDPKANIPTKAITAYLDSPEDTPANGKGSQAAAAAAAPDKEEAADKESESPLVGMEKDGEGVGEKMKSTERIAGEDEGLGENGSKDLFVSDCVTASDAKPEGDLKTDISETSAVETAAGEKKDINPSKAENEKTLTSEETKLSSSEGKAASQETAMPALPKVTQEMVNALLVECRTRTSGHPNNTAASTNGEKGETQMDTTEQGEKATETKEAAKNPIEEEEAKRQERETRRERERKDRERRAWEKKERERDERARREREKREDERREWERKERERRLRKRGYGEGALGLRSSSRLEGYKQSCWRDEQSNNSDAETKTVKAEEEEEEEEALDEFPFNMSDFVTVDEVGDVTDLPCPPSPTPPTEGGEDTPTSVQNDAPGDTPVEVSTDTSMSDATAAVVKADEPISAESEPRTVPTPEASDSLVSSDVTPGLVPAPAASPSPASRSDSSPSQTHVPTCQPEAPETATLDSATLDSATEVEPPLQPAPLASAAPADSSSNSPATVVVTAESEEDKKKDTDVSHSQATEEEKVVVSDKTEEHEKKQEDKDTGAPAVVTGKHERSEDQTDTEDRSMNKKLTTESLTSTDPSLPPFNPSNPVGMEFLVPKTGFFCKVCNRFFSGTKEGEINHCKTLKHYENLQKYLQTKRMAIVAPKPDDSS